MVSKNMSLNIIAIKIWSSIFYSKSYSTFSRYIFSSSTPLMLDFLIGLRRMGCSFSFLNFLHSIFNCESYNFVVALLLILFSYLYFHASRIDKKGVCKPLKWTIWNWISQHQHFKDYTAMEFMLYFL